MFIRARNKTTGAIASIPEGSLPTFHDWEPVDGPPPEKAKPKKNLTSQQDKASDAEPTE